jgi:sigma-B regulation protein RsbU (phosphoserine phosphatase)
MTSEICEKLSLLLQGRIPGKIGVENKSGEEKKLAETVNQLIEFMEEIHAFIFPLSKGELNTIANVHRNNYLASPFKELHSRLQHLTWQAGQVAKGDFSQRVDFMGDFSEAFNCMVTSLERKERALQQKIAELENAAAHIKKLRRKRTGTTSTLSR